MSKKYIFAFVLFLGAGMLVSATEWDDAEKDIKRLSPEIFIRLPSKIRKDLKKRGCTIPQSYEKASPHNVIQGSFLKKGQTDWAVLCSSGGVSAILIYPGGSVNGIVRHKSVPDISFLQGMGDVGIVYCRSINVIQSKHMLKIKDKLSYGFPNEIHDGISDIFLEKYSDLLYYDDGKWIDL